MLVVKLNGVDGDRTIADFVQSVLIEREASNFLSFCKLKNIMDLYQKLSNQQSKTNLQAFLLTFDTL